KKTITKIHPLGHSVAPTGRKSAPNIKTVVKARKTRDGASTANEGWGRGCAIVKDEGDYVKGAGTGNPVEVLGPDGTPKAGEKLDGIEG
ncbi:hypothetical protein ACC811_36720, partial [Rhizobium ruizarguesonis]